LVLLLAITLTIPTTAKDIHLKDFGSYQMGQIIGFFFINGLLISLSIWLMIFGAKKLRKQVPPLSEIP
jgi:hypothetical protein